MWLFNKKKIPFFEDKVVVYKHRLVDWNKVKTTKDLVAILRETGILKTVYVSEEYWNHPGLSKVLEDEVITRTYINGRLKEEEENASKSK